MMVDCTPNKVKCGNNHTRGTKKKKPTRGKHLF